MRRNFEELRSFLHQQYPALAAADSIRGEFYPPPPMAEALSGLGTFLQMGGVAVTLGGTYIFNALGVPQPPFVPFMQRNTAGVIIGLFFVNSVLSSFRATGAFEVTIDGELVFSRIQEKRFPTVEHLMKELDQRGVVRRSR